MAPDLQRHLCMCVRAHTHTHTTRLHKTGEAARLGSFTIIFLSCYLGLNDEATAVSCSGGRWVHREPRGCPVQPWYMGTAGRCDKAEDARWQDLRRVIQPPGYREGPCHLLTPHECPKPLAPGPSITLHLASPSLSTFQCSEDVWCLSHDSNARVSLPHVAVNLG